MIKDQTIDEALIEIMRTKKALEALRKARKAKVVDSLVSVEIQIDQLVFNRRKAHAAAKRASLDLTRKLADLRAGR